MSDCDRQQLLQQKLQALFDMDDFPFRHGHVGQAFVFLWSKSEDGRGWGSFQLVSKQKLEGRQYRLEESHTGSIHIQLLDDVFDPKTMTHSNWI